MADVQHVQIDPDSLSIDEMELAEDITGVSFDEILGGKARTSKILRAFGLIALRRENPAATLEDAGKLTAERLNELLGSPLEPQKGASNASRRSSGSRKQPGSPSTT